MQVHQPEKNLCQRSGKLSRLRLGHDVGVGNCDVKTRELRKLNRNRDDEREEKMGVMGTHPLVILSILESTRMGKLT